MPDEDRHLHQPAYNFNNINNNNNQNDHYVIMEKQCQQVMQRQQSPDPAASGNGTPGGLEGSSLQDVYAQLVQKERDLLLAAQLGKALLEKNEELGLQNERMAEDYSRQLEVSAFSLYFIWSIFVHYCYRSQTLLIVLHKIKIIKRGG